MKPQAAVIFRYPDGSIVWQTFDEIDEMLIESPTIEGPPEDGWKTAVRDPAATCSLKGKQGAGVRMPPPWIFKAIGLPAPATDVPADAVVVSRALLIEAAEHAELGSSDPYEDQADPDLARRLRAAAGMPA